MNFTKSSLALLARRIGAKEVSLRRAGSQWVITEPDGTTYCVPFALRPDWTRYVDPDNRASCDGRFKEEPLLHTLLVRVSRRMKDRFNELGGAGWLRSLLDK